MPIGDVAVTIVGTLGNDPEVRQAGGASVAGFSVAVTPRVKGDGGAYEDGPTTWYRVSAWRDLGENAAASLRKGMRVVVVGTIAERTYTVNGEERRSMEVTAEEVAPALRFATAQVTRAGGGASRSGGGQRGQQARPQQQRPNTQQGGGNNNPQAGWDYDSPTAF